MSIFPKNEVSSVEMKEIALAFDVNRNGMIDEEEFLA